MNTLQEVKRPGHTEDFWRGVFTAGVVFVVLYAVFLGGFFLWGWLT